MTESSDSPALPPGPVSSTALTGAQHPVAPWWTRAVIYQIYPRSFADSDGDGIGDIPGITARLDYLSHLSVDAIWLSPVYPSPQDDMGYDVSDYQNIDPLFGTLADFDELLADLHRRGMKLIIDLVVNHTSDEHPWFIQSRSSTDNPKRDWYWWRPARTPTVGQPRPEPTNWESAFSGSAWELDERTGEYYLHLFSRKQPDLNWENPDVRAAIHQMMRWWLDRGVDGFRMDVIDMISKNPDLPDGPTPDTGLWADGSAHYLNGPRLHELLQEMRSEVFTGRRKDLLIIGETPGATIEQAQLLTDPARRELDMLFQFEHVRLDHGRSKWDIQPLRLTALKASLGRWQTGLAGTGWNSLYWNNHDQPRTVSRFGNDQKYRTESAKMLATILHLHRGTPFIYQGDELGMTNSTFADITDFRDIESTNHYAAAIAAGQDPHTVLHALRVSSRDNARTPMQWDNTDNAGFTTGTPWIPTNPNHTRINAAAQINDPASVLHYYRTLIALRHREPTIALGDFTMALPDHETIYAYTRQLDDTEILVLGNFSSSKVTAAIDGWHHQDIILTNYQQTPTPGPIVLRPWEARVYRRQHNNNGSPNLVLACRHHDMG